MSLGWQAAPRSYWIEGLTGAGVAPACAERLAGLVALLARWQKVANLVGRVDAAGLLRGHLLESLAGVPRALAGAPLLDLGSGNGFPALPVLACSRVSAGVLLEPRERRWAFLREAVRELGLPAEVRRETVDAHAGEGYGTVTVRALALEVWAGRVEKLLAPGGALLWWTTATACERAHVPGCEPVVTSPLPDPSRGVLAVWHRRST